ncbi:MAG: alpha-amylase [Bdellovibrio sp. ArHS]|uniref:alpha-amylase n=1 Tax=Bdellovibrio sp. ArHS TaxID=1569284 RepID=UPI00058254F4|nr:alpha-amylase family protein [Bdellovibrio sp. ArHS]KHD88620.1 MAG: alpha-amylase [Bdellovibrio sp. ArHS]
MRRWIHLLALALFMTSLQSHAAPRTVFVQLFEWSWSDIAQECENYLGPAGFSAVQVSPPHEHIMWENTPWWERYQVVSYDLKSRSGDEAQFADMVRRCRAAGVDIYADAVINHATGVPGGVGFGGTKFTHYNYPGLYSYKDFHHCGRNGNDNIINYKDRYEVQNCELVDLADLATETEYVRDRLAQYLNKLLDLGVAGFRIDAAKHIPAQDLAAIYSKLKRSAYIYHEVIYDPQGPIQYGEYLPYGDVMAYDYSRTLAYGFRSKDTERLHRIADGFPDSKDSIVFVTNHDLERHDAHSVLSYNGSEQRLYRLSQVFMLAWPFGYPQLFSGFSFSTFDQGPPLTPELKSQPVFDDNGHCVAPWTCEHRLPEIAAMVDFRNQTDKAFYISNWWSNNKDQLSFSRGSFGFVAMNFSTLELERDFITSLTPGNYCNIVSSDYNPLTKTCSQAWTVTNRGTVHAKIPAMSAIVLLKTSPLKNRKR